MRIIPLSPEFASDDRSHNCFSHLISQAAGHTRAERLKSIDKFDADRRKSGLQAAWKNLRTNAPHMAHRRVLSDASSRLNDDVAAAKIQTILNDRDEEEIERIAGLLSNEKITHALRSQSITEESIRRISATSEKPRAARRWLRQQVKQGVAAVNLTLGLIGGGKGESPHCSAFEKGLRDQQKTRWQKFGEETVLKKGDAEISMRTIMNGAQKKRAAEVYALSKGLEKYAKNAGKTWAFITLTAPPQMHPNPSEGRSSWDGTLPIQAHKWLHKAWRRAEARLRKAGIIVTGVRVCEPHQDGCPHWHLLVFADAAEMEEIEKILREQKECPHWKTKKGLAFVLDDGRASAASYLFKYILKSLSSTEALEGEHGSVDAWRSTWGIRSMQWIGMPPVGLWRALRAEPEAPITEGNQCCIYQIDDFSSWAAMEAQKQAQRAARSERDILAQTRLSAAWRAARRGDGATFIGLAGGTNVKRGDRPIAAKTESDPASAIKVTTFTDLLAGIEVVIPKEKWQKHRIQKTLKAAPALKVEVIPNCPRKSKPQTNPIIGEANDSRASGFCGGGCVSSPPERYQNPPESNQFH